MGGRKYLLTLINNCSLDFEQKVVIKLKKTILFHVLWYDQEFLLNIECRDWYRKWVLANKWDVWCTCYKRSRPTHQRASPHIHWIHCYKFMGLYTFSKGMVAETINRARPGTESGGRAGSEITFPSLLYVVIFVIVDFIIWVGEEMEGTMMLVWGMYLWVSFVCCMS